jgi:hypothetical protein
LDSRLRRLDAPAAQRAQRHARHPLGGANNNPAVLFAFDARNLTHELYNSAQAPLERDRFGAGNKFIIPTIANGRVYVGTQTGVAVFGLLTRFPPFRKMR